MKHNFLDYLKEVLDFDNVLCRNLSLICNESKTIKPMIHLDNVEELISLTDGGLYDLGYNSKYINEYIENKYKNKSCYLLFDEVMTNQYESWFEDKSYFIVENEVYFYYNIDNIEKNLFEELFTFSSQPWHLVSIILTVQNQEEIAEQFVSINFLKENLQEIIIGAFDGEGYIHYYLD